MDRGSSKPHIVELSRLIRHCLELNNSDSRIKLADMTIKGEDLLDAFKNLQIDFAREYKDKISDLESHYNELEKDYESLKRDYEKAGNKLEKIESLIKNSVPIKIQSILNEEKGSHF